MNKNTNYLPSKLDHKLLRNLIFQLSLPSIVTAVILVILVGIFWISGFKKILSFGNAIDYTNLNLFGEQASLLIQQNNQYFWWAVCILCSLIIIWILQAIVRAIFSKARYKLVPPKFFEQLRQGLSTPALDVLLWAWPERDEPLRLGDLILAKTELRNGRSTRLKTALEQRQALEAARDYKPEASNELPQ